jgi:tetratricopeptide (TPR) repeat protein
MKFDFTIQRLQDGIPLTGDEIERVLLDEIEESNGTSCEAFWSLAVLYSRTGRQREAAACIARLRAMVVNDEEHARCQLAMGQLQEQLGDFEAAVHFYRGGLELSPRPGDTGYWLNNNLGYSLIQLGRPSEALALLEAAIAIDGTRPNAHKNLGLAHDHLGTYALAVRCFVKATQANASDPRSMKHLETIIAAHPEVLADVPGLAETLTECCRAVGVAAGQQPDARAHWQRLRDKRNPQ